jgi:anti-sigma B factor antagonist
MLNLNITQTSNFNLVEIVGNIDGKSALTLQKNLASLVGTTKPLVLDMHQINFMSSAGFRVLRSVQKQFTVLLLIGLPRHIRNMMELTGFSEMFRIAESLEDGLAQL